MIGPRVLRSYVLVRRSVWRMTPSVSSQENLELILWIKKISVEITSFTSVINGYGYFCFSVLRFYCLVIFKNLKLRLIWAANDTKSQFRLLDLTGFAARQGITEFACEARDHTLKFWGGPKIRIRIQIHKILFFLKENTFPKFDYKINSIYLV